MLLFLWISYLSLSLFFSVSFNLPFVISLNFKFYPWFKWEQTKEKEINSCFLEAFKLITIFFALFFDLI